MTKTNPYGYLLAGVLSTIPLSCVSCTQLPETKEPAPIERRLEKIVDYDNTPGLVISEDIKKIIDGAFKVNSHATVRNDLNNEEQAYLAIGTGFVVCNKDGKAYVMTCNHVIDASDLEVPGLFSLARMFYTVEIDDIPYVFEVVKQDEVNDVAILRSIEDMDIQRTYEFADNPLREGDAVYAIGYPHGHKMMSEGIITNAQPDTFFYTNADFNPGISGGPVYVFEKGTPRIAGMAKFTMLMLEGISGAVETKPMTDLLEDMLDD